MISRMHSKAPGNPSRGDGRRQARFRLAVAAVVGGLLLLGATGLGMAQFRLPSLPGGVRVPMPSLPSLGGDKPPITTGFADAVTEIPFLDGYEPDHPRPMVLLPRASDGSMRVGPGTWQMNAMSYCLHAGTHGPGKGEGYLHAPLAGPRSGVIRKILQRSVAHAEISQERIQVLIWAILARTRLNQANPEIRDTASRLLDEADVASLSGGGLDSFPPQIMGRVLGAAPPIVRQVLDAENTLRGMMGRTVPYEQLAAVAVRSGDPPETNTRQVPRGRWSYHPQGYLVRYVPNTYRETRISLFMAQDIRTSQDSEGRITAITDSEGNQVQVEYSGSAAPGGVEANSALQVCGLRTVRFVHTFRMLPHSAVRRSREWKNRGWTFAAVRGSGRVPSGDAGGGKMSTGGSGSADPGTRREAASAFEREIAGYEKMRGHQKRPGTGRLDDVRALGHLVMALRAMLDTDGVPAGDWRRRHLDLAWRAWMGAVIAYLGPATAAGQRDLACLDLVGLGGPGANTASFDASGDVATPANTGRQRLSQSDRPRNPDREKCAQVERELAETRRIREAFADQELLDQARRQDWDGREYDQHVKDKLFGKSDDAGTGTGSGTQTPVSPMNTDPFNDCKTTENWTRDRYREEGLGDETYESDRAHEKVHRDHCNSRGGAGYNADMSFPDKLSAEECAAYDAKIAYLEKWLAENCK